MTESAEEQIAKLQLEITNACDQVRRIVNQPVQAYARTPGLSVAEYPYWFHEGAVRPSFDVVDVRQTQQFPYASQPYVTSDLNPGVVFRGADLEFNFMTKYFYTDRSLPKHRLSEAEMLEINRLYRIIGHSEAEIRRLQFPVKSEAAEANNAESDTQTDVLPGQSLAEIRSIPKRTRLLYGGIAIGALIVLVVGLRLVKKKSE